MVAVVLPVAALAVTEVFIGVPVFLLFLFFFAAVAVDAVSFVVASVVDVVAVPEVLIGIVQFDTFVSVGAVAAVFTAVIVVLLFVAAAGLKFKKALNAKLGSNGQITDFSAWPGLDFKSLNLG